MSTRFTALLGTLVGSLLFVSLVLASQGVTAPAKKTVKAPDGLTIAYDVRGKGDTALVFIHGWCGDREFWKHQLDVFAKTHTVVALDLGGHSESGKDRKAWKVIDLASDVEAVIKAEGVTRVILVGHSMGGPVSLEVARRMPKEVIGIVGVDTLHNAEYKFPKDQKDSILEAFNLDFKGTLGMALEGMVPDKADPKLVKWLIDKAMSQDQKMALGLFASFSELDTVAMFKNAKVPIRCINAGGGFSFANVTETAINKKYADFDAVLMEGVGHFPMLEKPAEFNEKLRGVVKGLEASKK